MDEDYQTYLNRVARMTLLETYNSQLQHIQESPKFQLNPAGEIQAVPFPGYTIITPPAEEDPQNEDFYQKLQLCQQQLQLIDPNLIVPLPAASFHLTLADLIWDSAFRYATQSPDFEVQLGNCIAQIFQQCRQFITKTNGIVWQMLGLFVMPRAIGVCLIPQDESSYAQILKFRRTIYQSSGLTALGIEQHYRFTPHITLGYFGKLPANLDRDRLSNSLSKLNQQLLENSSPFLVQRAELRKFDDMTRYYRKSDWATLDF